MIFNALKELRRMKNKLFETGKVSFNQFPNCAFLVEVGVC